MSDYVLQEEFVPQYGDKFRFYRCPSCRELFYTERINIYGDKSICEKRYPFAECLRFCPKCGQELKWTHNGRRD